MITMEEATIGEVLERNQLFANLKNKEELVNYYDKWCETYDEVSRQITSATELLELETAILV